MSENLKSRVMFVIAMLAALGLYLYGVSRQSWSASGYKPSLSQPEVVLPAPISIVLAGGDKHLAGNLLFFRVLVASLQQLDEGMQQNLANLQQQVSVLLPAHEDNYYVAAATLPWFGKVKEANLILHRAGEARPHDPYPFFFEGFNLQYFFGDYYHGAQMVERAALAAPQFKVALQVIAAKWYARTPTPGLSGQALDLLIAQAREPAFKQFLQKQKARHELLLSLNKKVAMFRMQMHRLPSSWQDMIEAGLLTEEPKDPLGAALMVDNQGNARPVK
ncbi:hypothetical protein [Leeia oryzae]|uniref:hypothetical protein n=1 Tax=Leeia oryzae TaxID=356662 RepID=UPI00037EC723|nr:hypothetical protein [Leeia oryzae]